MSLSILVEPMANNGYRASSGAPLHLTAEAPTRAEAIHVLRDMVQARLAAGAEIVPLDGEELNPWIKYAGMFKDNPMFEEVVRIMAENRRKMDDDPNIL